MLGTRKPSLATGIFCLCLTMSDRYPISQSFVLGDGGHLTFRQQTDKGCGPNYAVFLQ